MDFDDKDEDLIAEPKGAVHAPVNFDPFAFVVMGILDREAPLLYAPVGARDLFALWRDKVELCDSTESTSETDREELLAYKAIELLKHSPIGKKEGPLRYQFVQNTAMPFIRAAVLAGNFKSGFLARAVGQHFDEHTKVSREILPIRGGRVPERYWIEMQHQMAVTGVDRALFVSTCDGVSIETLEVPRDPVFTSNHVAECIVFWDHVRRGVPPKNAIVPPDFKFDDYPLTDEEEHG